MVVVLVFLVVMMALLAVSQRRLDSLMRIESNFAQADIRGDRARAMGRALDLLWTGPPPADPYTCQTTVETSNGPQSYTVIFARKGGHDWRVRVAPTAPGDNPPPMPSTFAE
jgi:hypothetical protein